MSREPGAFGHRRPFAVVAVIGASLLARAAVGSTAAAEPRGVTNTPAAPAGSAADLRDEAPRLAPGAATSGPSVQAAHEHVRRGLALYDEGDLGGAHAELERAYDLAPSFKLLYNLAQISLRMQDYVSAARELRAYLAGGREAIPPPRKREVDETLAQLARRTAELDVIAAGRGARLAVDQGAEVALPLAEPVAVNVGRHSVTVTWPGGERLTRSVEVASGDRSLVRFDAPAAGSIPRTSSGRGGSRPALADRGGSSGLSEAGSSNVLLRRDAYASSSRGQPPAGHRLAWTTWAGAGVAVAGAAVAGALALRASRDLAADRMTYPVEEAKLDLNARRTRSYALAADILGAAAVLLTGTALYLTF